MAGSGGINLERPTVQIWWDQGDTPVETPVTVRAVNSKNGAVGIKLDTNDGLTNLTYPAGTIIQDQITVFETEAPENIVAEFTIDVHVGAKAKK